MNSTEYILEEKINRLIQLENEIEEIKNDFAKSFVEDNQISGKFDLAKNNIIEAVSNLSLIVKSTIKENAFR